MQITKLVIIGMSLAFFVVLLVSLKDYGISWDEPIHFYRGQAYLHFFLTGKKDFSALPVLSEHKRYKVGEDYSSKGYKSLNDVRKSYYQDNNLNTEYFLQQDAGHPPLNGILAALTNFVFYQQLGVMGDIESHHLFNILSSTLLFLIVTIFAYQKLGLFGAIVSGLTLGTYPLFFAEAHFNIKDPPQAAFFTLTIWTFWMSLKKGSWRWLLFSVIVFAITLGMKFNVLFLPVIIVPYLIVRYWYTIKDFRLIKHNITKIPLKYILVLLISPIIVITIFVGSWPFLWENSIHNFLTIVGYYKTIGTGANYNAAYYITGGFNLYPLVWILITTPPYVLFLTIIGLIFSLKSFKKDQDKTAFLWILWLLIPIIRVMAPNTTIYGGIRQIMEFIPAMALIAGLGAVGLRNLIVHYFRIKQINILQVLIILGFLPIILINIKLHPNENVYFNSFIGGLSGAKQHDIPYWGNSFGNAYWQAIQWLNQNAEPDAKLALVQGTGLNIPQIQLRSDIQYWNSHWSGIDRNGEYMMELTHKDPVKVYVYAWDYIDKFLDPVYEVKVDGVAIAKVWKNDLEHTKPEMKKNEKKYSGLISSKIIDSTLEVELADTSNLSRFLVHFEESNDCVPVRGVVETSMDGTNWFRESEPVPFSQISGSASLSEGRLTFFFAAKDAKFIRFIAENSNSCVFKKPKVEVLVF